MNFRPGRSWILPTGEFHARVWDRIIEMQSTSSILGDMMNAALRLHRLLLLGVVLVDHAGCECVENLVPTEDLRCRATLLHVFVGQGRFGRRAVDNPSLGHDDATPNVELPSVVELDSWALR